MGPTGTRRVQELEGRLQALETEPNLRAKLEVSNELAWELYRLDAPRALELAQEAQALAQELGDSRALAYSLITQSACHNLLSRYELALQKAGEAENHLRESSDAYGQARLGTVVGVVHTRLGNYDEAFRAQEASLERFRRLNDRQGEGQALMYMGAVHEARGNYDEAKRLLDESLQIFDALHNDGDYAQALLLLGIVHKQLSEYAQAIDLYNRALDRFRRVGDKVGVAHALNNLGMVYSEVDDYGRALELYFEVLATAKELKHTGMVGVALANIGEVYDTLGEHQNALGFFEESLEIDRSLGHKRDEATGLEVIGHLYGRMGDYGQAQSYLLRALERRRELGDRQGEASSLRRLGQLYGSMTTKAKRSFEESLELARAIGDRQGEVEAMLGLAELLLDHPEAAVQQLEKTLELAQALDRRRYTAEAYHLLSQVHEGLGRFKEALVHYKCYHALEQALQEERTGKRVKSMTLQLDLERAQRDGELHRLRTIELAQANEALEAINRQNNELLAKLKQQAEILEKQTKEDALTGLYNRRYLEEQLGYTFRLARRHRRQLTVAMIDIDNFKAINDTLSHQIGDEVLKAIAVIFKTTLRSTDMSARYGGEEFVLLFPETSAKDGVMICEKIRKAVEKHAWYRLHPKLVVTISAGVSDDLSVDHHEKLLTLADDNLYRAKRAGKNRVVG